MASLMISNMPEDLHRRLAGEAARVGQAVDQHAVAILKRALGTAMPVQLPSPIIPLRPVDPSEVAAGIREGRE